MWPVVRVDENALRLGAGAVGAWSLWVVARADDAGRLVPAGIGRYRQAADLTDAVGWQGRAPASAGWPLVGWDRRADLTDAVGWRRLRT